MKSNVGMADNTCWENIREGYHKPLSARERKSRRNGRILEHTRFLEGIEGVRPTVANVESRILEGQEFVGKGKSYKLFSKKHSEINAVCEYLKLSFETFGAFELCSRRNRNSIRQKVTVTSCILA